MHRCPGYISYNKHTYAYINIHIHTLMHIRTHTHTHTQPNVAYMCMFWECTELKEVSKFRMSIFVTYKMNKPNRSQYDSFHRRCIVYISCQKALSVKPVRRHPPFHSLPTCFKYLLYQCTDNLDHLCCVRLSDLNGRSTAYHVIVKLSFSAL